MLALAGAVCWAAGSMVAKLMHRHHKVDLLSLTAWQSLLGSIPLVLVAVFLEAEAPVWSSDFVWALAFSLILGTCLGSILWLYILGAMSASIAGIGTMATPVLGLLFSWAQLGEQPTPLELVGMVTILAGSAILFLRGLGGAAPAAPTGVVITHSSPPSTPPGA
jgi:drug/metabolite transporter (DMT)-like permease